MLDCRTQNNIPSHDTCFNLPWCFLSLSLDDTPGTTRAPASPSLLGGENLLVPAKCGFISVTENPTQGHHQKTPVQGFPGGSVIIHLPMQGIWAWSLVWEDPTCCRATLPCTTPVSVCSRVFEPQLFSPSATNTEACVPRACVLQQQKLPR